LPLELIELPEDFDRMRLLALFRLADDSDQAIAKYLHEGRLFALRHENEIVGHVQVVARQAGEVELQSLAISPDLQGRGHGRTMVTQVLDAIAREGVRRVLVATASADVDNLAFYQKLGFRLLSVERDAFGPENGYPSDHHAGGIPVRDRVWLDRELG
jgi:ribosomal protein S18 acetylase RimI-like enzyme